MQAITAKRKTLGIDQRGVVLSDTGTKSLFWALEVIVIFLSVSVSIFLPFYFGNEADKLNQQIKKREQNIVLMHSRLDDMVREISYLETVVGIEEK